jgi:F-type H+-transporting ATPase subunit epsilon
VWRQLLEANWAARIAIKMSSAGGPFYRAAGLTFLRYANISADLLRNVLKEPFKTKAQARQVISYRFSPFADGKQGQQSECVV